MTKERTRLERLFLRLEARFPRFSMVIYILRQPWAMLIRIPLGILFCIGGLLAFLPILGVWMLPLGLLLLAIDLPFLQRPMNGIILRGERQWHLWRRSRRDRKSEQETSEKRQKAQPSPRLSDNRDDYR
ncbi:hypothetical protein [Pelagibacterium halotolerans]|uniref:Uncharacterized protein n=1 Tax=Pelagibacterium halotolerans (strain DSM 22347 / JCM 15775 / CGMCC 1.7692 / B2) TaxID=1082931 RepID=G4R6U3_PELHB|nr:hypothetical protein [Pelagibacterium halotolerans]AEQ52240.1 hypothetical protein KKY_2231 [Pelagibacterium halotolerans B2]SEA94625.1 hypothetical protein SAMN05428936_11422 [Pelagibacterium halotolerans]